MVRERIVSEDSIAQCNLCVNDIDRAIKKLNRGKSDGDLGLYSDHIIMSTYRFKILLTSLINAMLIHGYNVDNLLASVIASIPKCMRSSLNSSENYRGIALCSALCKVIDYVFIDKYSSQLQSSNVQFAFKEGHDTVMCTAVLKETISYFNNRGSDVYACLLDASKAFDKVHFGKLFKLLFTKNVPAVVIRFLLDNYTRQTISAAWNGVKSKTFSAVNGVRQGGVLSPILFNIYFDEMLSRLRENGIGCKIGSHFVGALAYADDVTLICPSRKGLQEMINVCEKFGQEYCVNFNAKKTQCIAFRHKYRDENFPLTLGGKQLKWEREVNHLGNIVTFNLADDVDVNRKRGVFIGNVNKLFCNFGKLQSDVLVKLFQSYCCSFYGAVLWKRNTDKFKDICVEWNKAVRKVWRLPYMAHTNILGPLNGQLHISDQFAVRFVKFYMRMVNSKNTLVNFISRMANDNRSGFIYKNINDLKWRYNFNMFDKNVERMKCIAMIYDVCKLDEHVSQNVSILEELLYARDMPGTLYGFNYEEIVDMISEISTGI